MALEIARKLIRKETDADLISDIAVAFKGMGESDNLKIFLEYGSQALGFIKQLKEGNESWFTWRTNTAMIWKGIERIKRKIEGEENNKNMMGVLRMAEGKNTWYEKLIIYKTGTVKTGGLFSSRWNKDVKEAAGKALENISKLVNKAFQNPDKVEQPITPIKEYLADFFCKKGGSLNLDINSLKIKSETQQQTTDIPLLPLNDKTLNTYGGEAFYKFIKKACNLTSCAELKVDNKTITARAVEELPAKDKIIGFITPGVISALKLMTNNGEGNSEENKVNNLTKEIVDDIDKKVKELKKSQNNNV